MKPKTPRLKLHRETLKTLSPSDLVRIQGGGMCASRYVGGKYYPCQTENGCG